MDAVKVYYINIRFHAFARIGVKAANPDFRFCKFVRSCWGWKIEEKVCRVYFGKLSTWFISPGSVMLVKTFIRVGLVIVHCPVGGGAVIKSSFPTKMDGQSSWHQGLLLLATECDVWVALTCSWNLQSLGWKMKILFVFW